VATFVPVVHFSVQPAYVSPEDVTVGLEGAGGPGTFTSTTADCAVPLAFVAVT